MVLLRFRVQPGTGKTYIGSKLIKELTDDGFSVGIVGPSHAVVENMMFACVEAGVQDYRMFRFTGKHSPRMRCGVKHRTPS